MVAKRKYSFSSSQMSRLVTYGKGARSVENTGKPFDTYVTEKYREHLLCRPITGESFARPLVWGKMMERYVMQKVFSFDDGYEDMNLIGRSKHPSIEHWTGLPDYSKDRKIVGDIKAPWTLTAFFDRIDSMKSIETLKKLDASEYWQLVSNSILTGFDQAELTVFVPKENQLEEIHDFVCDFDGDDELSPFQVQWVFEEIREFLDTGNLQSFPYIPNESKLDGLHTFRFEVPTEDKELLTERVKMASELLNQKLGK